MLVYMLLYEILPPAEFMYDIRRSGDLWIIWWWLNLQVAWRKTSWIKVFLDKHTVVVLAKKFPSSYATRRFLKSPPPVSTLSTTLSYSTLSQSIALSHFYYYPAT